MITRNLTGRVLAGVAGVAMLIATATSASAFTLSAPSLEQSVATSNVDQAAWWHHRHCWWGPYHHWKCRYW
jgi:hypothetical protein